MCVSLSSSPISLQVAANYHIPEGWVVVQDESLKQSVSMPELSHFGCGSGAEAYLEGGTTALSFTSSHSPLLFGTIHGQRSLHFALVALKRENDCSQNLVL